MVGTSSGMAVSVGNACSIEDNTLHASDNTDKADKYKTMIFINRDFIFSSPNGN